MLGRDATQAVDAYLARRASEGLRRTASEERVRDGFAAALDQLGPLRDLNGELDFGPHSTSPARQTWRRSAGLGHLPVRDHSHGDGQWDSHSQNDPTQSFLFESLFSA